MNLETNPSYETSYGLHIKATIMMSKVAVVACKLYDAYLLRDHLEVSRLKAKIEGGLGMATKHLLEADTASPHPTLKKLASDVATVHEAVERHKLTVPQIKSQVVVLTCAVNEAAGV